VIWIAIDEMILPADDLKSSPAKVAFDLISRNFVLAGFCNANIRGVWGTINHN
jgi:hypothetical protein